MNSWIEADWPAPGWLHAGTTTRLGGVSQRIFDSFNLATHVGDNIQDVRQNRKLLNTQLNLPTNPFWLNQIHGSTIVCADDLTETPYADGAFTDKTGMVVAVLTADCLPLLLCDIRHKRIAAIHVGWRGFSQGIVRNALSVFADSRDHIMAWLGPSISARNYEVDDAVKKACLKEADLAHVAEAQTSDQGSLFEPSRKGHYLADIKKLVVASLRTEGVNTFITKEFCTYADKDKWYSFRRDGETGRMATLIWMDKETP